MKEARALSLVVGALGCVGSADPADPPAAPAAPAASRTVEQNLAQLRALRVFDVGEMVWQRPAEAFNCYGPCPGSEAVVERARASGAERLDRFTRAAERAAADVQAQHPGACEPPAIDANLRALRELRVVEVGAFLAERPAESANCYGLVCPGERERAERETCARAERLADIVDATRGL